MAEQPSIAGFLEELDASEELQREWQHKPNRRGILEGRGFSGAAFEALEKGRIRQLRELLQQERDGLTVFAYIK
jgi:hypothetical protein